MRTSRRIFLAPLLLPALSLVPAGAPRVAPREEKVVRYTTPSPYSSPGAIVAGADEALWFLEPGVNAIGRITTGGKITEFPIPTRGSAPSGIAVGSDGHIWFTESATGIIGRIKPGREISEFLLPEGSFPIAIAAGPDGNAWYTSVTGRIAAQRDRPDRGSPPDGTLTRALESGR
jgi:virginiamycin B lyase